MGRIITVANQKGGVGKTTTSINLSAALRYISYKVLLIDLDEQVNATMGLGVDPSLVTLSSYDLLTNNTSITNMIYHDHKNDLDLIPSSSKLAQVVENMIGIVNKKTILAGKIKEIKDLYDFIIIDCPPSLGVLVENALYASDSVLIPVETHVYALEGLKRIISKVHQIQKLRNLKRESLLVEGILVTKLDNRSAVGYDVLEQIKQTYSKVLFNTIIEKSSIIEEAAAKGLSVIKSSFNSRGSKGYIDLANELIKRIEERK